MKKNQRIFNNRKSVFRELNIKKKIITFSVEKQSRLNGV